MRLLTLLSASLLLGCPSPPVDGTASSAATKAESGTRLVYFTTSSDGDRSTLWSADLEAPPTASGTLPRTRLEVAEHAAGFAPRGTLSDDGTRRAWVAPPPGSGLGGPAELVLDGAVHDADVLYLQRPRFVDGTLLYLGAEAGPDRVGPDGRRRARRDRFELRSEATDRPVAAWDALWVQLCGTLPGLPGDAGRGLIVLRIDDGGAELMELRVDGSIRARWRLGNSMVRDVQPDPDGARAVYLLDRSAGAVMRVPFDGTGEPTVVRGGVVGDVSTVVSRGGAVAVTEGRVGGTSWRVPERAVSRFGVLWREHTVDGLQLTVESPDGHRASLAPPGDAAQSASVLGVIEGGE